FRGQLDLADLPQAWNEKYQQTLGLKVPNDAVGCLQDVHWSCGLFGYFSTYTLGNLYAAQFFAAAQRDLGNLDELLSRGEFAVLLHCLREKIHRHGSRYRPADLCLNITGKPLDQAALLDYLRAKIRPLYGLR